MTSFCTKKLRPISWIALAIVNTVIWMSDIHLRELEEFSPEKITQDSIKSTRQFQSPGICLSEATLSNSRKDLWLADVQKIASYSGSLCFQNDMAWNCVPERDCNYISITLNTNQHCFIFNFCLFLFLVGYYYYHYTFLSVIYVFLTNRIEIFMPYYWTVFDLKSKH